jgi:hypothetical protein
MEWDSLPALCYELLINYCEYFGINGGYRKSFANEYDYSCSLKALDELAFSHASYAQWSVL